MRSLLLVFLSLALSHLHRAATGRSTSKFSLAIAALLLIRPKENLRSVIIKLSTLQLLSFVRIQGSLQLPFKDQDAAGCINVLPRCAP
uniref:Putative secreted protein n=1 Tax=Ixodes scapularis TaxID=6945 RepID=A0A4D5RDZ5_IXOSC